jgi:hypothetical protein
MGPSDGKSRVPPVDRDALERARRRLGEAGREGPDAAELATALEGARRGLAALAATAADLEAAVPERLGAAVRASLAAEALPVGRHLAEVRGLTSQVIGRLERLSGDLAAERAARVEDLALLVDLVASGWQGVERRLDRLERILDRVERALERPEASLYPIEARGRRTGS